MRSVRAVARLQHALNRGPRVTALTQLAAMLRQSTGVVQRKPADIHGAFPLKYAADGTLVNAPAVRGPVGRAALINWKIREEWVTPNQTLLGGHLFKREFGGPDNDTNVVPWVPDAEKKFTTFEEQYSNAAKADAIMAKAPVDATVTTEAIFVDRPEFEVQDAELNSAGWGPTTPGRDDRKNTYHTVAERMSEIPNSVTVVVSGLPSGPKQFTAAKTDIEPPYVRNPAALQPAFVPTQPVFTMNPGLPKVLKKANWVQNGDAGVKKLSHEYGHAGDFGVTGNWKKANGQAFETALETHITAPATVQILGTYRSTQEVLHYVDLATNLWACTKKDDGALVAAWKLATSQLDMLLSSGIVK